MPRTINHCQFCFVKIIFKFIPKKCNKKPLPVGIKSEREKGTSFSPSILAKEGGELNGAIFFQRQRNHYPASV